MPRCAVFNRAVYLNRISCGRFAYDRSVFRIKATRHRTWSIEHVAKSQDPRLATRETLSKRDSQLWSSCAFKRLPSRAVRCDERGRGGRAGDERRCDQADGDGGGGRDCDCDGDCAGLSAACDQTGRLGLGRRGPLGGAQLTSLAKAPQPTQRTCLSKLAIARAKSLLSARARATPIRQNEATRWRSRRRANRRLVRPAARRERELRFVLCHSVVSSLRFGQR